MKKQVDKEHYRFAKYVHKERWATIWHQLDEVLRFDPDAVLEVGPGPGLFKAAASRFLPLVETLDVDPELRPDYVGSVFEMPFSNSAYDVVCAFQMLEHLPYDESLKAFREMARVARKGVVISLPDSRPAWPYSLYIPKMGMVRFYLLRPTFGRKGHCFDGEHYWEINKKGYPVSRVAKDFSEAGGFSAHTTYRVKENPYHRFFVFRK